MDKDTLITQVDDNTIVITSEKLCRDVVEKATYNYNKNNYKSSYYNESSAMVNFKPEDIDDLAYNAQSQLNNILKINNIIRYFINKNDILGKVHEAIETNINSQYELIYPKALDDDKETFEEIKSLIEDFNDEIGLEQLIIESIPLCFDEGNYIMNLRKDSKNKIYSVDNYPLKIAEIADYKEGGEPYVLININELTSRLRKIYKKNRKGVPLFYKNMDEEIQNSYPPEVYTAYQNKEQYAKLDIRNTGVMRINNLGRKYGLSPIFKTLKPIIRLENLEITDDINTQAKGKKIIFQKTRKELMTDIGNVSGVKNWYEAISTAHGDIIAALQQNPCVYTAAPWVESLEYVEPKLEQNDVPNKKQYRMDIMTALGINFLNSEKVGASQISIAELMKLINKIALQLSNILQKWYKGLLIDNNYDISLAPKIKILDSEQLSSDIVNQLITTLFSTMGCSYFTAYKLLGVDASEELRRRKEENEQGYDNVFKPHLTSYTANNDTTDTGRPSDNKDLNRKQYDKERKQDDGVT